jgi:hypothetical protein
MIEAPDFPVCVKRPPSSDWQRADWRERIVMVTAFVFLTCIGSFMLAPLLMMK